MPTCLAHPPPALLIRHLKALEGQMLELQERTDREAQQAAVQVGRDMMKCRMIVCTLHSNFIGLDVSPTSEFYSL